MFGTGDYPFRALFEYRQEPTLCRNKLNKSRQACSRGQTSVLQVLPEVPPPSFSLKDLSALPQVVLALRMQGFAQWLQLLL